MFGRLKVLFKQSSQLKEACARKDYSSIVKVSPSTKVITIGLVQNVLCMKGVVEVFEFFRMSKCI